LFDLLDNGSQTDSLDLFLQTTERIGRLVNMFRNLPGRVLHGFIDFLDDLHDLCELCK